MNFISWYGVILVQIIWNKYRFFLRVDHYFHVISTDYMNYTMHFKYMYFIEMYNETSKLKLQDLTQSLFQF